METVCLDQPSCQLALAPTNFLEPGAESTLCPAGVGYRFYAEWVCANATGTPDRGSSGNSHRGAGTSYARPCKVEKPSRSLEFFLLPWGTRALACVVPS